MSAIQIGPLALPTAPLPWLAALVVALLLVPRLVARLAPAEAQARAAAREGAERCVWGAAAAGFVVSRAVYVAVHWDVYGDTPWNVIDLRDGGWAPWPGVAAALAWVAWQAWRATALRQPLALGAAAAALGGALVWASIGHAPRGPLPALELVDLQGRMATLPELVRGRPAVINLWASWCGPCKVEMPALAAAARAEPAARFVFVNQGERAEVVARWLAPQAFKLDHVWLDMDSRLGPAIGSSGLPTTLFVDANGQIVHRHMGLINEAAVRARLAELKP